MFGDYAAATVLTASATHRCDSCTWAPEKRHSSSFNTHQDTFTSEETDSLRFLLTGSVGWEVQAEASWETKTGVRAYDQCFLCIHLYVIWSRISVSVTTDCPGFRTRSRCSDHLCFKTPVVVSQKERWMITRHSASARLWNLNSRSYLPAGSHAHTPDWVSQSQNITFTSTLDRLSACGWRVWSQKDTVNEMTAKKKNNSC